jgi:hypothetical protein
MPKPLRIAFVGRFYYHNGSSHALLGYIRAAPRLRCEVRASTLGIVDKVVQEKVPIADTDWQPDIMVLVLEEQFLSAEALAQIERLVPRAHRIVIDPDGKYFPILAIGADTNHQTPDSRTSWATLFDRLADTILQPCLATPAPGTQRFLYFGIDSQRSKRGSAASPKSYDLVYVGNNWYRWHDIEWLLNGLAPVRLRLGRIALFGQGWSGISLPGYEQHTYSEPEFLRTHRVETYPSAAYDEVESVMGEGRLNPIFVRPVLNALGLATPRMFETFAANTVPILPPYFRDPAALYGTGIAQLCLPDEPANTIVTMLDHYADYANLAEEIRLRLATEHSYEARLAELIDIAS